MGAQKPHHQSLAAWLAMAALFMSIAATAFVVYFSYTAQQKLVIREEEILHNLDVQSRELDRKVNATIEAFDELLTKIIIEKGQLSTNHSRRKRHADGASGEIANDNLRSLSLSSLSFLRGPRGAPGVAGTPGRDGRDGAGGQPGVQGQNGRDGQRGPIGPKGDPGHPGAVGARGPPGTTGQRGLPGSHGATGSPGVRGPPGASGTPGLAGSGGGSMTFKCPSWTSSYHSTIIGSMCYVIVTSTRTWASARSFCDSNSYNLAIYNSSAQQSLVDTWKTSKVGSSSYTWSAGYRKSGRPQYEYFWRKDHQDIPMGSYKDWASSEPDYHDYCMYTRSGNWYGTSCNSNYYFICEGTPVLEHSYEDGQRGGAVYTRWGRTSCANSSLTLYAGRAGGAYYNSAGGGVNFQCLPPNPELNDYNTGASSVSWMRSVEYESSSYNLFSSSVDDKQVLCSVCYTQTRPAILIIPAKTTCPTTWVKEYSGFLMAAHETHTHPTTYECVDRNPQYYYMSSTNGGGMLYFVNIDCSGSGSIGDCNNYRHGRQVSCVVCSK